MNLSILFFAILIGIIVFVIVVYNRLVSSRNYVRDAWSGIDVQLKKRHDLIPLLVKIVKSYSQHEKELLTKVTQIRTPKQNAAIKKTELAENSFGNQFNKLLILAEAYPEIKADENFRQLQSQLFQVEADIESARRYYNGSVRDLNINIESFPANLIASKFGFRTEEFFKIELPTVRNAPKINR